MKYIRVIEDSEEYITTRENLHDHILALQDSGFDFEGGIIKEADTIVDLCDELVYDERITFPKEKPFLINYQEDRWLFDTYAEDYKKGNIIYGAIWTDKGLIYVAKMNDKGELELL